MERLSNSNMISIFLIKKTNYKKIECEHICKHCGKGYKQRSGLWRHNKSCIGEDLPEKKTEKKIKKL